MRQVFNSTYRITQNFGQRPEYYIRFGLKGHEGIDLIPTSGDWKVKALEDGVVVRDEDNRGSGVYGNFVTLWHKSINKATQYAHLNRNYVNIGQVVKKGQDIGLMGASGNTQGAHLHLNVYEVNDNGVRQNRDNGYNGGIDPLPFLEEEGKPMANISQEELDGIIKARDDNWDLYKECKDKPPVEVEKKVYIKVPAECEKEHVEPSTPPPDLPTTPPNPEASPMTPIQHIVYGFSQFFKQLSQ